MLKQMLFTNPLRNIPTETKRKRVKVLLSPVEAVFGLSTAEVVFESTAVPAVSERIAPKNIDKHGIQTPWKIAATVPATYRSLTSHVVQK